MRYKLRITRAVALIVFLCALASLYASDKLRTGFTEQTFSFKPGGYLRPDESASKRGKRRLL